MKEILICRYFKRRVRSDGKIEVYLRANRIVFIHQSVQFSYLRSPISVTRSLKQLNSYFGAKNFACGIIVRSSISSKTLKKSEKKCFVYQIDSVLFKMENLSPQLSYKCLLVSNKIVSIKTVAFLAEDTYVQIERSFYTLPTQNKYT